MIGKRGMELTLFDLCVALLFVSIILVSSSPDIWSGATGHVASTVFVVEKVNMTCNLTLVEGWNLVSTYCEPFNGSIETLLAPINSSFLSVHSYEASEPLDYWKVYNPTLPGWTVQDLNTITRTKGYWINMQQNDSLDHNGTWYSPTIVNLNRQWILSGYPTNVSRDVNESLKSIISSVEAVYLYNASDQADPWKVYNPSNDPALNDLTDFVPYHGLWFKMTGNTSWMVIW